MRDCSTHMIPQLPGNRKSGPADGQTVIKRVGFDVTASDVREGKYAFCGTGIAGVWGTPEAEP